MSRQALGRGLSALLGDKESSEGYDVEYLEVEIDLLKPNSEQPRETFSQNELEELAQSIRANGVVQPIVVRRSGSGYQIVAGERRWRAAQRAGLPRIPAVVRDVSDDKLLELALIENIQRQKLNPVEEARAYKRLIDSFGMTQELVANQVGKTRPFVANYLRLLNLPKSILTHLENGKLSVGHARALLALENSSQMRELATKILGRSLSVRDTEKAVKKILTEGDSPKTAKASSAASKDPNVREAESKLRRKYGTHVSINESVGQKPGRIEFEFYGEQDLNRLFDQLMGK